MPGPAKMLRRDLIAVTKHETEWFMARDMKKGVAELRGKPIHSTSIGWELGAMADDGLIERRKVTKRNNDYGSWEYRVRFPEPLPPKVEASPYAEGIEKHLNNLSEFKLKGDKND